MNAFQAFKMKHSEDCQRKDYIYAAVKDWKRGNPRTLELALNKYGLTPEDMTEEDEDYIAELIGR